MALDKERLKVKAEQNLAIYQAEVRRNQIRLLLISGAALLLAVAVWLALAAGYFDGWTNFFGLRAFHSSGGGVYADCNDPRNKDMPHCRSREGSNETERDWQDLTNRGAGKASKFKLTN